MRLLEKFWAKVDQSNDCWLWRGAINRGGYGRFYVGNAKASMAHRFAYETTVGPIPAGLQLDHLCRVRNCVRPDHLEPVTPRENVLRSDSISNRNREVTHCPQGHEYSMENLVPSALSRGARQCRTCKRRESREWYLQTRGLKVANPRRGEVPHGDQLRYRRGCRCDECRIAYIANKKARALARDNSQTPGVST